MDKLNLFPKDFIHLKELIDKANQRNNEHIRFKGIQIDLTVARKLLSYGDKKFNLKGYN